MRYNSTIERICPSFTAFDRLYRYICKIHLKYNWSATAVSMTKLLRETRKTLGSGITFSFHVILLHRSGKPPSVLIVLIT